MRQFKFLVYAQQFFSECIPIYVFYAIMFADRGNLSTAQISVLFLIWGLVGLLSEIPTGVLADKYSRKYALFLGDVLRAMGFCLWLLLPNFIGFALGFILWGIGGGFASGAFEAYLYDELKGQGKTSEYQKIFTRCRSLVLVGQAIAYIAAGVIGGHNYAILIVVSIILSLTSASLCLRFPKERIHEEHPEDDIQPRYLRTALGHVRRTPLLARYVISIGVLAGILAAPEEFASLYYKAFEISDSVIAALFTADLLAAAAIAWYAHRFWSKRRLFQLVLLGLAGTTLVISSLGDAVMAAIGLLVSVELVQLALLQYETLIQHEISDKVRATTTSLGSLLAEATGLIGIGLYGLVSQFAGTIEAMRAMGYTAVLVAAVLMLYWRRLAVR